MQVSLASLGEWLVGAQLLTQTQLDVLVAEVGPCGLGLANAAIARRIVAEDAIVALIGERFGLPPAPPRLHRRGVPAAVLRAIPEDMCWQHRTFPFGMDCVTGRLQAAICDPADPEALAALRELIGHDPLLHVIGPRQLEKAIRKHYMDSWVDETRGPRRFFGYEELTDPGMHPKGRLAPVLAEPVLAAPVPAAPELAVVARLAPAPAAPQASPGAGPQTEAGAVLGRIAPVPGPSPTGQVRERERAPLARRMRMLEQAVDELLELLSTIRDERIAPAVARIRARLQG